LRLIESKSLKIEEAALTGESVAVEKEPLHVEADAALGDRSSMAFSGTLVSYGIGRGVVVGTGANTELGKISRLLSSTTQIDTPLTQSLAKFGKAITIGVVVVAVVLLVVGYLRNFPLADAVLAAVTLAVAAIPEGLPAVVTITLAIGVRRMADRRAVIRKLPAVETLGSATVICSDKTGTLTDGQLRVVNSRGLGGVGAATMLAYAAAVHARRVLDEI
jgi:P-type E1-E2 ATPase